MILFRNSILRQHRILRDTTINITGGGNSDDDDAFLTTLISWITGNDDITSNGDTKSKLLSLLSGLKNNKKDKGSKVLNTIGTVGSSIQALKDAKASGDADDIKAARNAVALGIIGSASDTVSAFLPDKQEYSGKYGSITKGADDIYDEIANKAPGWFGASMKANKMLTGVLNAAGGATSGNTWKDALLGSSWFGPLGSLNGFLGSSTSNIVKDDALFSLMGSSYTGTSNTVDEAISRMGTYGVVSLGAQKRAEDYILKALRMLDDLSEIANLYNQRSTLLSTMSDIIGNQRTLQMLGGLQLDALRAGKQGMKIAYMLNGNLLPRDRTVRELVDYALETNPEFIQRLQETPEWFMVTPSKEPGSHLLTYMSNNDNTKARVYPEITVIEGVPTLLYGYKAREHAIKNNNFLEMSPKEAELFTSNYKYFFPEYMNLFHKLADPYLDENGKVIGYKVGDIIRAGDLRRTNEEKQENKKERTASVGSYFDFTIPKTEASIIEPIEEEELVPVYRKGGELYYNPLVCSVISAIEIEEEEPISGSGIIPIEEDLAFLRDGGEINIIPDGALHKELHHMEDPEGEWTRKGIPVVDAEGNLVAEIEKSEIILKKSLIEYLEECTKKYYAKEATKEEKELLALDAGITLVNEILYNTEDKTKKML